MKPLLRIFVGVAMLHAGAAPASPGVAELTRIVYPHWQDSDTGRVQSATLPGSADGWGSGMPMRVEVLPKVAVQTSPGTMTLIVGLAPTGDGGISASHALPMGLSAYHFKLKDGRWNLTARQEAFAYAGFFAEASVRPFALSSNVAAIGVESGSCWQGYCGSWMSFYQLGEQEVAVKPIAQVTLEGYNYNSTADCRSRLRPLIEVGPGDIHDDDAVPADSHACYKISGSVSIEPSTAPSPATWWCVIAVRSVRLQRPRHHRSLSTRRSCCATRTASTGSSQARTRCRQSDISRPSSPA